ncbi:MAG TPA: serine/threonine-protein kinase [Bryobacteraceae bacterium]|nr:serine/threonine-protein kinase [Bryobacteraceae bacterium]
MNSNIGDRIGDYEIVSVLGAGGMGRVYKVRNVISDRVEAMKVLLPDLANVPELADRFVREIKVLATLDHPGIAALRTAQRIDNQLVMIMELVEGTTLEDRLKTGPLPVAEAMSCVSQVLSALSYAHARGVIHRDIKPANMMVTEGGVVKLMDFGIAKAAGDRKLTMTGTTMGSLYYMSPEQIKGGELDARSDLYSLGVSMYELVTGARPFRGDSDFSIMSAHLEKEPVPPVEVDPRLPADLNEIILMSIAKDPAKRFQSADAFAGAIRSVSGIPPAAPMPTQPPMPAPVQAAPPPPAVAPPPARSSHRGLYMALGAIVAIAVLAVGALQLPKWLKTRAGDSPVSVQEAAPVSQAEPVPAEFPPAEPVPAATPAARAPVAEIPRRASPPATATPAPLQSGSVQQPAPAPSPAPAAPAADAARAAALKAVQKEWPMLASRAGAVAGSLQNLQEEQRRSGFGLRGDITASWKRMEHYMDQVEAAISAKDPDAAREHMESAEREITTLEKFLGR